MEDTFETGGKPSMLHSFLPTRLCASRAVGVGARQLRLTWAASDAPRAAHREEKLKERQEAAVLTQKLLRICVGRRVAKAERS